MVSPRRSPRRRPFDGDEPVIHLKTLGVVPEYRGEGVGTTLTAGLLEHVDTPVVAEVWLHGGPTSEGILTSLGFEHAVTVDDHWVGHDDVSDCPACGGQPCTCPGAVYWYTD